MLYIIGKSINGPVKIGHSSDPRKRLSNMNISFHCKEDKLKLLATGSAEYDNRTFDYCEDVLAEKLLHCKFAAWRLEGEWFDLNLDDLPNELYLSSYDKDDHIPETLLDPTEVVYVGFEYEAEVMALMDDNGSFGCATT